MALCHRLLVLSEGHHAATLLPPYSDTEILTKALPVSERRAAAIGQAAAQEM